MDTQTEDKLAVYLSGIGTMIEDRHQYEAASALCLLSIARSQERIADATEMLVKQIVNFHMNGVPVVIVSGG